MDRKQIKKELINIAAELVRGEFLPSPFPEDYEQKTLSARKVAKMAEKSQDVTRKLAIRVREVEKQIPDKGE